MPYTIREATYDDASALADIIVRVLMVNPHRHFYEHLNAQYVREEPYDWGGVILSSGVYCWPDTALLRNSTQA